MFTQSRIKNFRNLKNVHISGFERVNIITGKNNCGKSALLEAIYFNCSAGNTNSFIFLSQLRGENFANRNNNRPLEGMFTDFDDSLHAEIDFDWQNKIGDKATTRHLRVRALYVSRTQGQLVQINPVINGLEFNFTHSGNRDTGKAEWVEEAIPQIQQAGFGRNQLAIPTVINQFRAKPGNMKGLISAFYNSPNPRGGTPYIYNSLVKATREKGMQRVIDAVRIIDERVSNLTPLNENGQDYVYVDLGYEELMPLSMMGVGFSNALHIICGMLFSNCRVICIDEVEVGIYYQAFKDFASSLIRISEALNLQLFITTHSGEMINAFSDASKELEFDGICALRFDNRNDGVHITRFDKDDLRNANEIELDLR